MNRAYPSERDPGDPSVNAAGENARIIPMTPRVVVGRGQPPDAAIYGLEALQELDRMLDAHFD